MKNTSKLVALFLALIMVIGALALVGCANDPDNEPDNKKDPGSTDPDDNGDDGDDEDVLLPIDYLPDTKYSGGEVHVAEWTVDGYTTAGSSWVPWEEIAVDIGDGDPINNAIYDRNGVVEEKYDVTITREYIYVNGGYLTSAIRTNASTGSDAYQMITTRTLGISAFCLEGLMTDMNTLDYLHTDMPWWNADSVASYTMGNTLYFAAPEMLLRDKGATATMYFNADLAEDEGVEDLFQLVEDGEWTMEKMIKIAESVAKDVDGDDAISSSEDIYGLSGTPSDVPYFLYTCAGRKFAVINDDGYLELTFGDEESINIWQEVIDTILYADYYFYNAQDSAKIPSEYDVFTSGHSLFNTGIVRNAYIQYRNMEDAYGILPIPKYDSYQEGYASLVWMHHDSVLGIPGSCVNKEAVSVALEYMSYLSYYKVYPVFYETIILGKSARDQHSKEMLEIIFKTRSFDPGLYWLESVMHSGSGFWTLRERNVKNVSSLWESLKTKVNTAVDEFNEKIDELS